MEYGILKINTTQNNSNGISNKITILNLDFFNSTIVLISQFAYEGEFRKSYPDALAGVTHRNEGHKLHLIHYIESAQHPSSPHLLSYFVVRSKTSHAVVA